MIRVQLHPLGRAVHVVGVVLFALSVYVQGNDPDPLRWMALYAAALVVCAAAVAGVRVVAFAAVVAVVAGVWGAFQLPSLIAFLQSDHQAMAFNMKPGDALEEEARECGGLFIACAWCAVVAITQRRARG
jgi:hypothetical protein